jgi:beta-mannosidase
MNQIDLCGDWTFRCLDAGAFAGETMRAVVPGSMYADLLSNGKMDDPFFGENELDAAVYSNYGWEYSRTFTVSPDFAARDSIELVCEGLDTLAEIFVNGVSVARTSDMHRTFAFDVRNLLRPGENEIRIAFDSPTKYMNAEFARQPLVGGSGGQYPGFNYLRKSHSMSGWDWGPVLPDVGIWRPIYIRALDRARLQDVYVTQSHSIAADGKRSVSLNVRARVAMLSGAADGLELAVALSSPSGKTQEITASVPSFAKRILSGFDAPGSEVLEGAVVFFIDDPELWWPNNLGAQPLYEVSVFLRDRPASGDSCALDSWAGRVGLRTMTVEQKKDEWGSSFAITVNGVSFFAMGADYVPEDSLVTRNTRARTERLIKSAARANHNCIRVWGGANYPEDDFYDLCDEYGLVIWHDHMMACGVYELSAEFRENIVAEIIDNVKRIRHHASLGLWCGNNEQEEAWCSWGWSEKFSKRLKADYIKLYEEILPALNREIDPSTFFWLSSPSSTGSFDVPNAEGTGDMHNWSVWHGIKPFTAYRDCYTRFASEFGIESFPSMRTIESFTQPDDRNIFSPVMESHQKCASGNAKSLHYVSETYRYPKDFSSLVYASQLIQAEGLRYGVEHWRRNRNANRCMGAVYWQLNDCWPVASWASIDFFGRWKALHYVSKRFFEPVLVSAREDGLSVALHVTNETAIPVEGTLIWRLCDDSLSINGSRILETGKYAVRADAFNDVCVTVRDFSRILAGREAPRNAYLVYEFMRADGSLGGRGSVLFVKSKHFNFVKAKPSLSVRDSGERFEITVASDCYSRFIELETSGFDALFSDNCFDLGAGDSLVVTVEKNEIFADSPAEGTVRAGLTADEFAKALTVRSIVDTY